MTPTGDFLPPLSQGLISAHCLDSRSLRARKEITIKMFVPGNQQMGGSPGRPPITCLGMECVAQKRGAGTSALAKKGGGGHSPAKKLRTMHFNGIMEWWGGGTLQCTIIPIIDNDTGKQLASNPFSDSGLVLALIILSLFFEQGFG